MRKIIENYRGFDIEFDTEKEIFISIISDKDENSKTSSSYSSVKKYIDDYVKNNQTFKPFYIIKNPKQLFVPEKRIKITGIRKDGRFVGEDDKGNKTQISSYDESNFIIKNQINDYLLEELEQHEKMIEETRLKNNQKRNEIIGKMNIITLKEHKKSLI